MQITLAARARPIQEANPIAAARSLPDDVYASLRRQLVLDCCKWDPQVGDMATLAPFPLVLRGDTWRRLARWAEALSVEVQAAESEMMLCPNLLRQLGLPSRVRRVVADSSRGELTPAAARVIRFDFHWTTDGWRISEANCDVPGGFTEASSWTQMLAPHYPGCEPGGDPAARWADSVARANKSDGTIAILVAPGYMEDQQVAHFLADQLRRRGLRPHVCDPRDLRWSDAHAHIETVWYRGPVDSIVRFYQGEWLARLPRTCRWQCLLRGGRTPVCNSATALLTESKRFPLAWDQMQTHLPTWRTLLPETREPREAPWETSDEWLLKAAYCNTGDEVAIRAALPAHKWRDVVRAIRWNTRAWVAQRRFEAAPISTPIGTVFPCVGVYTVDGRASGIYGRISFSPVVDYMAMDVAILVEKSKGAT